ncbi:MAG: Rieske 2Fe-2S domain-containing protein [Meiothermus silvanus]|nr:Rieske 2Fe-2S domain-containing protein [Allomeiothermus silvanus]
MEHVEHAIDPAKEQQEHIKRRAVLQAAIGVGVGLSVLSTLYVGVGFIPKVVVTPEKEPVKAGDILVWAQGAKAGQDITPADLQAALKSDPPFIIAYPMNPDNNVVMKQAATNTIMVMQLEPSSLSPETAKYAAQGIVAYSAICKHLGCTISQWKNNVWHCPCHGGEYDPRQGAKVVAGPPPGPVPQLPIKLEGNRIVATAGFLFKPGADV